MLEQAVRFMVCPLCESALESRRSSLVCAVGHTFDIARQGYVSFVGGHIATGTADAAEMVAARQAFLAGGYFDRLVGAVATAVQESVPAAVHTAGSPAPGCIVDVGAGPGTYLTAALDKLPDRVGIALDLSKHAVRHAARAHPRIAAAASDTWSRLPVATGAAAVVLDVFAPRNAVEFARILEPEGVLVVVTPTPRHLREAVETLGLLTVDEDKPDRLAQQLGAHFTLASESACEYPIALSHDDLEHLALMGPSAWHVHRETLAERIATTPQPFATLVSARIGVYRPR